MRLLGSNKNYKDEKNMRNVSKNQEDMRLNNVSSRRNKAFVNDLCDW